MDTQDFCAICNTEFQPTRKWKKYCSKECQISGKRRIRKLYIQKKKLANPTQTGIIIENIDEEKPSVFDASDLVELFSDWKRLVALHCSATGRVLKYVKSNGRWSLVFCNEVWTLQQWGEWLGNCQSQDVAYILTGVELDEYYMVNLLQNDTLAAFATGGKLCLSHYTSKERTRLCLNIAPPWGQKLIWQWQGIQNPCRLSIFFVARGSGTVHFTCFPRKISKFDELFSRVITKCSNLHQEIDGTNQVLYTVDNSQDWEENLFEELNQVGISPLPVEVTLGQCIIIPSEQPFWYEYCNEGASNDPLILISGHGDYLGPTTESFQAKFWGLLDLPENAEDMLFQVVRFCCRHERILPTARNHFAAALPLLAKFKRTDEKRKEILTIAQDLLNRQPSLCEENSLVASGREETSTVKSHRYKRKEIDRDISDQPPLKKFRSNDTRTSSSNGREDETLFNAYVENCNLPMSITVLPIDTWKSQPPDLVDSVKNKKYAIVPVLDRCSLIIFVDLYNFLTGKSPSCSVMYCNSLCQRLKKPDVVSFLSSYTKTKPSWSSIKVARINDCSTNENSSVLALIDFLELFASKPFASKEEMTKEDKKKWKKWGPTAHFNSKITESFDTENDDDSM